MSVRERILIWNRWTDLYELLCADPLWTWLGPHLAALRYVLPVVWMTSRLAVVGRMAMRCDTGAESDVYECLVDSMQLGLMIDLMLPSLIHCGL